MKRKLTLTAATLSALLAFGPAMAADEFNVVSGLTAAGAPLGVHGVDVVSLIEYNKEQAGSAKFTTVHDGVSYYFTSAKHQKSFEANPSKYIPQNGGFCTYGVSVGKKFDGDPSFASVVDGKLYVFLNEDIYNLYLKDQAGTIHKAEENWKKIQHTAAKDL
ncbi:hypothetical protein rosmuc_01806 [Roseovarius mucosus DSM 17069]|uniref:YHS domain protein n=1 Tax=Roseovarius mucosus DSM 17069 TaxID=1288298 RepID=A0A0A0HJS8_9RHOB|nr:YHS domain-containing (seleno)protein [Roseovarius mucosus]KGM88112.1 hypothetical protein rosmuc_01806 [Roseovarius mucosus DSM 17069]